MPTQEEVITFYNDAAEWGGQEILSAKMANILASSERKIQFFYFSEPFGKALSPAVKKIKLPFSASTPFPIFRDIFPRKRKIVERLFQNHGVKNLVVCQGNIERCLPAILAASKMDIPIVSYCPMMHTQKESAATFGSLRDIFAKWIYPKVFKWVVISQAEEALLRRFIPKDSPVFTLQNPLSWETVSPPRKPEFPLRIATVGRIYFIQKGQDAIPETAKALSNHGTRATFEIFGNGPDKRKLGKLILKNGVSDCVSLQDWISPDALKKKLSRQIDLVFIPSHFEGEPIVLFEALACGIPVLAANEFYTKSLSLPEWMLYDRRIPNDSWEKIAALPSSYDREEFLRTRERLFRGRSEAEFSSHVLQLFGRLFPTQEP